MANTEETVTTINASRKLVEKFSNKYIVFRSFFGFSLLTLAFLFFTPLLKVHSDWARLFLVVFGGIVLLMAGFLVAEYIVKIVRIQNSSPRNYSALVAINTLLGFLIPLFYSNLVLSTVIKALGRMFNYQTFLCELRYSIVNFYYWNNIYYQINQFIYLLLILIVLLFIVGGFIEVVFRKYK